MGRTLAIGDVHGCATALRTLLAFVGPNDNDTIIMLGDYVDRGLDSKGVIDLLDAVEHPFKLVCLQGNHELMMRNARHDDMAYRARLSCGGWEPLESYRTTEVDDVEIDAVPAAHWEFLSRKLLPYFETDSHIFVHANPLPDRPMESQPEYALYWEALSPPQRHQSGKVVVRGHTSLADGVPLVSDASICIDTKAHAGNFLTCVDPVNRHVWQANELGETRQFPLDAPPASG